MPKDNAEKIIKELNELKKRKNIEDILNWYSHCPTIKKYSSEQRVSNTVSVLGKFKVTMDQFTKNIDKISLESQIAKWINEIKKAFKKNECDDEQILRKMDTLIDVFVSDWEVGKERRIAFVKDAISEVTNKNSTIWNVNQKNNGILEETLKCVYDKISKDLKPFIERIYKAKFSSKNK